MAEFPEQSLENITPHDLKLLKPKQTLRTMTSLITRVLKDNEVSVPQRSQIPSSGVLGYISRSELY